MAAPWALTFTHDRMATRVHVIAGAAVLVIAGVELLLHHHHRQRRAAEEGHYRRARMR